MTFQTNKGKMFSAFGMILLLAVAVPGMTLMPSANADTNPIQNNFTVIHGDDIKNNPFAQTMLERIEIMKQRIVEMQNKQKQISEHQKLIDEQRKLAKQRLVEELNRMNNDNKDHTPKAAFSSFVSKMPENVHSVYWGMYDYQQSKVKAAQNAMKKVLDNGGSLQDARDAYNSVAASKRVDLIEETKNLNIHYGLADSKIQVTFDKYGKLPRTE